LEVLKLFFESLFSSVRQSFDLMVFDNGSCVTVQDYLLGLRRDNVIQYLILSEYNLRKLGALNFLLSAAPGEVIAYADSDVFFLPGWLEASLNVLEAFPEAAKVTSLPIFGPDYSVLFSRVLQGAERDPSISIQTGHLVPERYITAHQLSLGETDQQYQARLKGRKDVLLSRGKTEAFLSTADFQFMITKEAAHSVLPLLLEPTDEYNDPIYSPVLESRLEAAGFWQLSTTEYLVHHMGNQIPDLKRELPWANIMSISHRSPKLHLTTSNRMKILGNRYVRRVLKRINTFSYKLLYG
jgi:glycosyltransferase involved in cell wall biosynthesis